MKYVNSRKFKYYGSISLFSLLVLSTALVFLHIYNKTNQHYYSIVNTQNEIERTTLATQYSLKRQVQEWKNILLRGGDANEYNKYHDSFSTEFENTKALADQLKQLISTQSKAYPLVDEFIDMHQDAMQQYQTALVSLKASNFSNPIAADKLVKGIDRAPDQLLERIVSTVMHETKARRQAIINEHSALHIFLASSFIFIQIIFCLVLLRVSGQLLRSSLTDPISFAGNRLLFIKSIDDCIKYDEEFALAIIDIDEFKIINETCGNKGGNEYLKQLAILLKQHATKNDLVSRISGDAFGIIIKKRKTSAYSTIFEKISADIANHTFYWGQMNTSLSACTSYIALEHEHNIKSQQAEDLLNSLYATLQHAKDNGRGSIVCYSQADKNIEARKVQMRAVNDVTYALANKNILLFKQAITPLHIDNKSRYFEVLIRIQKANGELQSPGLFLQTAERFQLISKIDRYVLENTLVYLQQTPNFTDSLSINLSGQTLSDSTFVSFCKSVFERYPIDMSRLGFEITETDIIKNLQEASKTISYLTSRGCKISLDDFGTGMSSYGYISELNIHTVKVDGSFIQNIDQHEDNQLIVKSIVQLCHDLNMNTVAEFVETKDELTTIKKLNIDYAQGYLLHRPELFYKPS